MKIAIPFFLGGRGRGVSEEDETLGKAPASFKLLTAKDSQNLVTPPLQVFGSTPGEGEYAPYFI